MKYYNLELRGVFVFIQYFLTLWCVTLQKVLTILEEIQGETCSEQLTIRLKCCFFHIETHALIYYMSLLPFIEISIQIYFTEVSICCVARFLVILEVFRISIITNQCYSLQQTTQIFQFHKFSRLTIIYSDTKTKLAFAKIVCIFIFQQAHTPRILDNFRIVPINKFSRENVQVPNSKTDS